MKKIIYITILTSLLLSCQTIGILSYAASGTGLISASQADAINKSAQAGEKALEEFTPEQEYYIGRAVGAAVLSKYDVLDDYEATIYINKIGLALTFNCDKPQTYGGYFFLILDSDEINAFAAPSGHIFISKGMLNLTKNEDDIAAILAHEISHVVLGHGISAIKSSRRTNFFTTVGTSALKELGSTEVSQLTTIFEDSISDMTSTLINSGYSRTSEKDADKNTIKILKNTGYDPHSLIRVLNRMEKVTTPGGLGFGKTHPEPKTRVKGIKLKGEGKPKGASNRYNVALGNIIEFWPVYPVKILRAIV